MKTRRGERGFGLVELLISLAITGTILSTLGMTLVAVIKDSAAGRDQQSATHQLRDGLFWLNQDTQSAVLTQSTIAANDAVLQWTDYSTGSTYSSHYQQVGTDLQRTLTVNGAPTARVVARNLTAGGFTASLSGASVTYTLTVQNGAGTQSRTETTSMRVSDVPITPFPTVTYTPTPTNTPTQTSTSTPTATATASAPVIDAVTNCTATYANSFTWSHTVGAGSNRLLLVGISMTQVSGSTTVSSITYSGQPLTKVAATNAGNARTELWRLVAPPSGTANIVVTLSANERTICGASSWTGVNQTTPLGAAATASGTTTSVGGNQPSVSVSSASGEVVHDVLAVAATDAVTVGAGQTQRWSQSSTNSGNSIRGAASTEPGASSVTMSWTGVANSTAWAIVAAPIKPVGSSPTATPTPTRTFTPTSTNTPTPTATPVAWFQTGSYTGDGSAGRTISGLSFQPDIVIVRSDGGDDAVIRTSAMPAGTAKDITSKNSLGPNLITSFGATSFVVGNDTLVNASGTTYYWTAMKAGANVAVGSYAGNGSDNRNITGVAFQPSWVVTMGDGEDDYFRPAPLGGDASFAMNDTSSSSNRIQAILSNGFQVGSDQNVNQTGITYYWIAFASTAKVVTGTYTGNGADNRNITGLGVNPGFVWVKRSSSSMGPWRTDKVPGDRSLYWDNTSPTSNRIQSLISGGFQVGSDPEVNNNGSTFYYLALAP